MRDLISAETAAADANIHSDVEPWLETLRSLKGHYTPVAFDKGSFRGHLSLLSVCGLDAVEVGATRSVMERTSRDIRRDDFDHYNLTLQIEGTSTTVTQCDAVTHFGVGGMALVSSARPVVYATSAAKGRWLSVKMPRSELITHIGFEPRLNAIQPQALLQRLLFDLVTNVIDIETPSISEWMKLAVYDLVGAMCASPVHRVSGLHSDKVFDRVHEIVRARFSDPELGGQEIAAAAGISLRYMQKLFTMRGSTLGHFITALRLDHAACLLRRRALTGSVLPLAGIAYASGFRDYNNFARAYRRRFGRPPGAKPDLG